MKYDKTNRGILFRNEKKEVRRSTQILWLGNLNVEGVEYYIDGWTTMSLRTERSF
jgi:hypothetical protein